MAEGQPLLIDVSRLIWRAWSGRHVTGIDRVCLAYLRHYRVRAQAVIMTAQLRRIISPRASAALFDVILADRAGFRRRFVQWAALHGWLMFRGEAGEGRICLNIGHTGLDRPGLVQWYRALDLRPVHFIHDLIPITHPQYCRAGEADRHRLRMDAALTSASGLVANSQATVDSLEEYAARQGMRVAPIVPAWLGVDDWLQRSPVDPSLRANDQFVVLGTIEARKNHRVLIDAWRKMAAQGGNVPTLHIVGQRGWEVNDVLNALDRDHALRRHVIEHRSMDDGALRDLLDRATALLFPSLVEGYGLPMVEAMAAGVPVIASDLPVFREIGCGVPTFVDASDVGQWVDTIRAFQAPDGAERARQTAALHHYSAPSWAEHFRLVDGFLAQLDRADAEPFQD